MDAIFAIVVGIIAAAGVFLMLQRRLLQVVLGVALLAHAANAVMFLSAGVYGILDESNQQGAPAETSHEAREAESGERMANMPMPIIPKDETALEYPHADPLPQAFVLTAIVISFGVTAFLIALAWRTYYETGTDDVTKIWEPEPEEERPPDQPSPHDEPPPGAQGKPPGEL